MSIENLNDNIGIEFLRDILKKFGLIEKVEILHHPLTKQHLGLAKVTYYKSVSASLCVEKLKGASVMGNVLDVFLDPFGMLLFLFLFLAPLFLNIFFNTFVCFLFL